MPYKKNAVFVKKGERIAFEGKPFYVGKGTGGRHKSMKRNRVHLDKIKGIINRGHKVEDICIIFKRNLTELEALELEAKLITYLGCINEIKGRHFTGKDGGFLINTDYSVRPEWIDRAIKQRTN